MKLSVIIPVFNEEKTLAEILDRVQAAELPEGVTREIVLVDDCSTDSSREIIDRARTDDHVVVLHERNRGKGAALKTGFARATGNVVIIQDADLEYFPEEYGKVIQPILDGKADVVYGSRFMVADTHEAVHTWHMFGNQVLTFLSNLYSDLRLTDMETCYKAFSRPVLDRISLEEKRFGFEPEVTAKVASLVRKEGIRIWETRVSYVSRTFREGKKIGLKDAFRALWCIVKYNDGVLARITKALPLVLLAAGAGYLAFKFLV